MDVSTAIRFKRAVREFSTQPIADHEMISILNAGRRAQSSKNTQPWHFVAITDKATLKSLSECARFGTHLAGSALGVAIVHPDPGEKFQLMFDIGQTAAYMQLAAWEMGIGSCLVSIYELEKARGVLDLPIDMFLHIAISFGYPQDNEVLLRSPKIGGRKPLNEIIHWNKW